MFEICVGLFWPSMSTMRSKYIPEASMSRTAACISSTVVTLTMAMLDFCIKILAKCLLSRVGSVGLVGLVWLGLRLYAGLSGTEVAC